MIVRQGTRYLITEKRISFKDYLYCKLFKKKYYIQGVTIGHYFIYREDCPMPPNFSYYEKNPWANYNDDELQTTLKIPIDEMSELINTRFDVTKSV